MHVWPAPGSKVTQSEVGGKPQRAEQVALFWDGIQNRQLDRQGPGEQRQLESLVLSVGPSQKSDPVCLEVTLRLSEGTKCHSPTSSGETDGGGVGWRVGFLSTQLMFYGCRQLDMQRPS